MPTSRPVRITERRPEDYPRGTMYGWATKWPSQMSRPVRPRPSERRPPGRSSGRCGDGGWGGLDAGGMCRGWRNIMLYWDGVPNVEVGVLLDQPCPLTGRVVASALPAGIAAMTVHRGPFAEVGSAHDAVHKWCTAHGRRTTGTRWEVDGPHSEDPGEQWTEVYWLVA